LEITKTIKNKGFENNTDDIITKKIKLFDTPLPFVYVKISSISNRYRISANYEFLNTKYNLKINYIRKLSKIDQNELFYVDNNLINFMDDSIELFETFDLSDKVNTNYIEVYKYIDPVHKNTIIYFFKRVFNNDVSSSVLFVSDIFFNLNLYFTQSFAFLNGDNSFNKQFK